MSLEFLLCTLGTSTRETRPVERSELAGPPTPRMFPDASYDERRPRHSGDPAAIASSSPVCPVPSMSDVPLGDDDLLAYLDELLPPDRAAQVELALRDDATLRQRAAALLRQRDDGHHTLGDIWRRHRLSCPSREQLGESLLGTLPSDWATWIDLHVEVVRCRWCRAEREALLEAVAAGSPAAAKRRERIFESSIGARPSR